MQKFFSTPVYVVLSLTTALFISLLIETDAASKINGITAAVIIVIFSELFFDRLQQERLPKPQDMLFVTVLYSVPLLIVISTAFTGYHELAAFEFITATEALVFPSVAAFLIGIVFWIGSRIITPWYEDWKYRKKIQKEHKKMKNEVSPLSPSTWLYVD